jgi:drug/metabolite transporter superfamily protein YnfA
MGLTRGLSNDGERFWFAVIVDEVANGSKCCGICPPNNDSKVVVSFHVLMLTKFSWLLTTRPRWVVDIYSAMDGTFLVFARIETRGPPMNVERFACSTRA